MKKIIMMVVLFMLITTCAYAQSASDRTTFASEYEYGLLMINIDATIRATGKDKTTLSFSYILINRPFVTQMINNTPFILSVASKGFKRIRFSNGYDYNWTYKIP